MQQFHWANKLDVTLCIAISFVRSTITSSKRITSIINVFKYPHYSQIVGGIRTMQWRNFERFRRFQRLLYGLLYVIIEIDQLKCVNFSNNSLFVGRL